MSVGLPATMKINKKLTLMLAQMNQLSIFCYRHFDLILWLLLKWNAPLSMIAIFLPTDNMNHNILQPQQSYEYMEII